jgi:long-chain acyl-CoA synthetase
VLEAPLRRDPDAPALVTAGARLSYRQLDEAADRAAGALFALGVRPGDRVAASLPNDCAIVVAFHAAMRLGAVWVGINRVLAPPEKWHMLDDSGASLLLADETVAAEMARGPLGGAGLRRGRGGGAGLRRGRGGGGCAVVGPGEWAAAVEASGGRPSVAAPDPLAPAAIAYTSGTTGFPKGAVHCQAGLVLPGAATVARRGWGPDLRKGDSLPLTILNMQVLTTVLTAQSGAVAVIMDRSDVASIVDWIRREAVTVWNGPPAQLHTMVGDDSIRPEDLASLSEVWVGGADCPDALRCAFESRFGVPVSRTYGLTEAPALVSIDDGVPATPAPSGASGRPLDHIEVSSVDGEIVLGPAAGGPWAGAYRPMLGYWHQPEASAAAFDGARLRTGDLGGLGDDGHLRVLGRKSQVINRGGANVYPAEVERVLAEAPGVAACAVVGVPDERLGERVGAAVEAAAGGAVDEQAILAYCRASLAAYKVPEMLVYLPALPRNQMGKVPRDEIAKLFTRSL